MSLIFLTHIMFVNDESFRQISQNCDYFCIFKNPRNSSEIRTLAQQMTPGNNILVQIYMDATKGPFSYLFINLTQECDEKFKFLSHLFDNIGRVYFYIVKGQTYRKEVGYGNFNAISFKNNNNEQMIQYIPYQDRTYNQQIYQPRLSNTTYISMPQTNFNDGHVGNNIVPNTPKVETVGVNPQTQPMQYAEAGTNTNLANNRFAQTQPMQYSEAGTNTNLPSNILAQTHPIHTHTTNTQSQNQISTHIDRCKCEEDEIDHTGSQYRSEFARQLQRSEVIPNAQPVTNYKSERPRQTESPSLYHIPQQSITHTPIQSIQHNQPSTIQSIQTPALQYRQTHGIQNMETDAIDYHTQKPLHVPQAITHPE